MTTATTERRKSGPKSKYTEEQIAWMNELRRGGKTAAQISEAFHERYGERVSVYTLHTILDRRVRPPALSGREVHVTMSEETRLALIALAEQHGLINTAGSQAGRGSLGLLAAAIARGDLKIVAA